MEDTTKKVTVNFELNLVSIINRKSLNRKIKVTETIVSLKRYRDNNQTKIVIKKVIWVEKNTKIKKVQNIKSKKKLKKQQ